MDYNALLDTAVELGYHLAMCGAETFRVEESIDRILSVYGLKSESFAITNCLTVSIETPEGETTTKMKRIGHHGNDLDAVERYNALSRRICAQKPTPAEAAIWLEETHIQRRSYRLPVYLFGNFLAAAGFAVFFGGGLVDSICSGICGVLVGLVNYFLDSLKVNPFFRTIAAAFLLAIAAYGMGAMGFAGNTDAVVIGALMILVPGLLFTNAMRDIIFGDTNSGINRIVQVLLVAAAIALGTGSAWSLASSFWGVPVSNPAADYSLLIQCISSFVACVGFFIVFNIHGPGGFLCALGGVLSWFAYSVVFHFRANEFLGYFVAGLISAIYAEMMARIRKYPAISYLVISIFTLIPGAGIYYATNHLVKGEMERFATRSTNTIAIAGAIAVGILLVSTTVRLWNTWLQQHKKK